VGGGEPLDRFDIVPDGLGGLALGGQVQPERADLRNTRAASGFRGWERGSGAAVVFLSSRGSAAAQLSAGQRFRK
jgi:hypothetical protein